MTQRRPDASTERVVCPASKDPPVRLFIMAGMLLLLGIWCWMERNKFPAPDDWGADLNQTSKHVLNAYGGYVFIPPGLVLAGIGFVALRRVLVADEEGIGYQGKQKIRWDQFTGLDASKLKSKGILWLKYGDAEALKLDEWKLKNFRELLAFVQDHLPEDVRKQIPQNTRGTGRKKTGAAEAADTTASDENREGNSSEAPQPPSDKDGNASGQRGR